jgi:hypothetical protein
VPKLSREELRKFAVKEVVDRFFDGSPEALARFLKSSQQPVASSQNENMDASLL